MKNKKKQVKRPIDLSSEIVADLEASEIETEAIKGGGFTAPRCGGGGGNT